MIRSLTTAFGTQRRQTACATCVMCETITHQDRRCCRLRCLHKDCQLCVQYLRDWNGPVRYSKRSSSPQEASVELQDWTLAGCWKLLEPWMRIPQEATLQQNFDLSACKNPHLDSDESFLIKLSQRSLNPCLRGDWYTIYIKCLKT